MKTITNFLTTNRLRLIHPHEIYAQDIFKELTPEITTYLSFYPPTTINETLKFITHAQETIKKGEEIPVIAIDKFNNEFIGCSGIHKITSSYPELGIWIKKPAHKKGYGKEILSALIEYITHHIPHTFIRYPVAKNNIASRKLIESIGGIIYEENVFKSSQGKVLDEIIYKITP